VVYLLSYAGATIPALIAGQLTTLVPLPELALAYGIFALLTAAYTLAAARNPAPNPQNNRLDPAGSR
jgi:hypothetical protein